MTIIVVCRRPRFANRTNCLSLDIKHHYLLSSSSLSLESPTHYTHLPPLISSSIISVYLGKLGIYPVSKLSLRDRPPRSPMHTYDLHTVHLTYIRTLPVSGRPRSRPKDHALYYAQGPSNPGIRNLKPPTTVPSNSVSKPPKTKTRYLPSPPVDRGPLSRDFDLTQRSSPPPTIFAIPP